MLDEMMAKHAKGAVKKEEKLEADRTSLVAQIHATMGLSADLTAVATSAMSSSASAASSSRRIPSADEIVDELASLTVSSAASGGK
jgi:hypothetical protein